MNGTTPRSFLGLTQRSLGLVPRASKDVSPEAGPVLSSVYRLSGGSPDGIMPPQRWAEFVKRYGSSAWFYAALQRKAVDQGAIPIKVLRRRGAAVTEVEEQHPARQLLRRVNDFLTFTDMVEIDAINLGLTGNSYWLFFGSGPVPDEVWPVPPSWVRVVPSPTDFIAGYVVRVDGVGEPQPFLPINRSPNGTGIMHVKRPNPASLYYGQGELQPAWGAVMTDEAATEYRYFFYKNSARPDGVLSTEKQLTDAKVDQLREWWRETFRGQQNAHRVAVLDSSLKYQSIAATPKDADVQEDRKLSRDDILVATGVSLAVLGIETGDVGRREEQVRHYYESTIKPACLRRASTLTEFLGPKFGPDIEFAPDFSQVGPLQEDQERRSRVDGAYLDRGVTTINEVRSRLGKAPVPWGDAPFDRFGLGSTGSQP